MQKRLGMTLLEVLLVVAVSAMILMMAVRYYFAVNLDLRLSQASQQIQLVTKASYDWLRINRQANFAEPKAITLAELISTGLINPQDKTSAWGKSLIVSPGIDPTHVAVIFVGTDLKSCDALSQRLDKIAYRQDCNNQQYQGEF